jgi:hypothetical protein
VICNAPPYDKGEEKEEDTSPSPNPVSNLLLVGLEAGLNQKVEIISM